MPNYYKIITQPVDFTQIKGKLKHDHSNHYQSIKAFLYDLRQVFINCAIYNKVCDICMMMFKYTIMCVIYVWWCLNEKINFRAVKVWQHCVTTYLSICISATFLHVHSLNLYSSYIKAQNKSFMSQFFLAIQQLYIIII